MRDNPNLKNIYVRANVFFLVDEAAQIYWALKCVGGTEKRDADRTRKYEMARFLNAERKEAPWPVLIRLMYIYKTPASQQI